MNVKVEASRKPADRDVVEAALAVCRAHQAFRAQILRQRLELVGARLRHDSANAECQKSDLAPIEDALAWFCGFGADVTPSLKRDLLAIRERLLRKADDSANQAGIHTAA